MNWWRPHPHLSDQHHLRDELWNAEDGRSVSAEGSVIAQSISWRGDGEYFAVSTHWRGEEVAGGQEVEKVECPPPSGSAHRVLVFDRYGSLSSTGEKELGLRQQVSWR